MWQLGIQLAQRRVRNAVAGALVVPMLGLAQAQDARPAEEPAAPPLRFTPPSLHQRGFAVELNLDERQSSSPKPMWQRLSVVELPAAEVPGSPPGRKHHALQVDTEAPKAFLRGLGIDASECAARFRLPSKMSQAQGAVSLDVQAQVSLGCRF